MADVVNVKFNDVKWPNGFDGPSIFEKNIRIVFLKDREGVLFGHNDLLDILKSYVQDEFDECPTSLDFSISFIGK